MKDKIKKLYSVISLMMLITLMMVYFVPVQADEEDGIKSRTLLSIRATYNGSQVPVGGSVDTAAIEVKARFRIEYEDGSRERVEEVLDSGWSLSAYSISRGENTVTVIYRYGSVTATDTITIESTGTIGAWIKEGIYWRYQYDDGTYVCSEWRLRGNEWYYLDEYGYAVTGTMLKLDNATYHFSEDGVMSVGWRWLNNKWYYFDLSGAMSKGWIVYNGDWYHLDNDGIMNTGWLMDNEKWYYLDASGAMVRGWLLKDSWFYMDPTSGAMCTGWVKTGNKWYYLDTGGAMVTNTWVGNNFVDKTGAWTATR